MAVHLNLGFVRYWKQAGRGEKPMRRKAQLKTEPVVPAEILEQAKLSISPDRLKQTAKCSVCGAETSALGSEPLCWVCRRLKISAWREIEQQMPAQE
jgi:hypothetical protein